MTTLLQRELVVCVIQQLVHSINTLFERVKTAHILGSDNLLRGVPYFKVLNCL